MLVLNAAAVRRALPMKSAVDAMKQAFADFTSGRATVPPRIHMKIEPHDGDTLVMPAFVNGSRGEALTVKIVSLFGSNVDRGLPLIQAVVVAFEADTGRPVAILDGAEITAIRTAAASGAATDLLARPASRSLAILGAGVQARSHIRAVGSVRAIENVRIFSRTRSKVFELIADMESDETMSCRFEAADSPRDAVNNADIVCSTTTSSTPVFEDADLSDGVHINAVGSYKPAVREIPGETVCRARIVVDSREAAWEEAGDLIQPLQAGQITREHIHAELGELVLGNKPARTSLDQTTLFKSVGLAVQDAAAAQVAISNAKEDGIGQTIDW